MPPSATPQCGHPYPHRIRQWCVAMGLTRAEHPTPWVGLFSQGDEAKLARWSLVGMGIRQQVSLFSDGRIHIQPPQGEANTVVCTPNHAQPLWQALENARKQCSQYPTQHTHPLPFTGGLVGLLHYDAAPYCDAHLQTPSTPTDPHNTNAHPAAPIMVWQECNHWMLWCHATHTALPLSHDTTWAEHATAIWRATADTPPPLTKSTPTIPSTNTSAPWAASLSPHKFSSNVAILQRAIRNGDCYQANLSIRFEKDTTTSPWEAFEEVSTTNPSPFAAVWHTPHATIISNSPERLVNTMGLPNQQQVSARPIAGTRGRGQTQDEDTTIGNTLISNEKERAEHLMLVDLLRNDIGKVATPGTVTVDELMVLERYSHVTHLVSNVMGQLASNTTPWQVIKALFPGGTITGCPKVRCCQWLAQCEPVHRGMYTGSMGYVDAATGQLDMNILIRSAMMTPKQPRQWQVQLHAGAGIVLDSVAEHEYRECQRKAAALMRVF